MVETKTMCIRMEKKKKSINCYRECRQANNKIFLYIYLLIYFKKKIKLLNDGFIVLILICS